MRRSGVAASQAGKRPARWLLDGLHGEVPDIGPLALGGHRRAAVAIEAPLDDVEIVIESTHLDPAGPLGGMWIPHHQGEQTQVLLKQLRQVRFAERTRLQ